MIDYSYYPFLKGSLQHQHINQLDEQVILYAQDNIEKYTPTKQLELDTQVWLVSTIMLRCLNNNFITRKFVSNYSKTFEYHFTKDIHNKEIREEIMDHFKIKFEFFMVRNVEHIKIHMMDYTEVLDTNMPQFSLPNQTLHRGFVFIETPRFLYLLRLALEHRLYEKMKSMKLYTGNQIINKCVKELDAKYPRFDKAQAPNKDNIPGSIKELISKAYEEHHLDHRERIKLGIYLQKYNFDMDYILDIFRALSDWNEKVTRYQLQSLKRYIK